MNAVECLRTMADLDQNDDSSTGPAKLWEIASRYEAMEKALEQIQGAMNTNDLSELVYHLREIARIALEGTRAPIDDETQ